MSFTGRLAAVVLALALPGTLLVVRLAAPGPPKVFSLEGVPTELPGYAGVAEQRLSDDALAALDPDAYLQRLYAPPEGDPVWLYVGLYSGVGAKGAHDPDVCYPAQGWEVTSQRNVTVKIPGSDGFKASILIAERGGQTQLVLYWFQGARQWPGFAVSEQLARIYDSLRGAPQYAFVRLSAHYTGDAPPEAELRRLAAQLAPHIRGAVDTPDRRRS
jgi:EpsI family protein